MITLRYTGPLNKGQITMANDIIWTRTHCARMDHGGCSLLIGVRGNRIVKIKGDPDGPLNRGYTCIKAKASADKLHHPDRLLHPLKRVGKRGENKWKRITWEEALSEIASNLDHTKKEYGAKSVVFCQGMPKGTEHFAMIRLANIFGSPNVVAVQDVCHAPRETGGFHTCGFYPVVDLHHTSKVIILWGSNITATNEEGIVSRLLVNQVKEGTEIITIDPRRTAMADRFGIHLQIIPGTDNALALGFLNVIIEENLYDREFVKNWTVGFDELAEHVKQYRPETIAKITGVPDNLIRRAAKQYATSSPAAIQWGNPIEQNTNNFDTVRAIVCLMAICGNLDIPGGNIQANEPQLLGLGRFVRTDLIPSKKKEMIHAYHKTVPGLMTVPPAFFRSAILDEIPYPVKACYIQCANPVVSYADSERTVEAISKLNFVAVSDIFMTPTAMLADIVLPAATQFEFNDIGHWGLGHGYVLARPKIVDPPQECWPDIKILNELGKRLTSKELWFEDYNEMLDEILKPANITYREFVKKGYLKGDDSFKKYISRGFKTPSGKVELRLSHADKLGMAPLPQASTLSVSDKDFPLILTSAKSPYYLHSSYRWLGRLRKLSPKPEAEINPVTAAAYGIRDGDEITIETGHGRIWQFARITEKIREGVVSASYGWWFASSGDKGWKISNFNMLTSVKKLGKAFGTPNLKGIPCRIRRSSDRQLDACRI